VEIISAVPTIRPHHTTDERRRTLRTIEHWIAGKPTTGSSDRTAEVFNPATGEQQAQVCLGSAADVDAAVAAAKDAFHGWSQTSLSRRTKVLFAFRELVNAHAGEIAELITDEHGKVLSDALGEVQRGLEVVEFACGIPSLLKGDFSDQVSTDVDTFSFREPLGVVAGITPFNFPAMVPMWMFPVAIACGNAFVLKPSERDPSASMRIAELWQQAGLPDGVFNVVHGDKEAVDAILDSPDVAAVSFVGSTPIARYIHERGTATGKRVQALGGAKNHAIILPDADVDFAADHLAAAAFGSAGERCMAISAAVAVGGAADAIVEAVNDRARAVKVGSGRDRDSEMGPVVTRAAQQRILGLIDTGESQGASVTVDGRGYVVEGHEDGFFVGPTVIDNVTTDMDVYTQEIFGPVLSVVRVDDVDAAIALVNSNPYGNGTAIFTSSGEAARRFQRGVHVGMIGINVPVPVPMAFYSFGGWKDSLFGDKHVHGPEGVSFYTRAKVVTARWPRASHASEASYHFPTSK
jgi:malonate-semialdehyde dehydrogenase (acetylating) / methylmalonate-semialdehyde dehydrogenase